MGGTSERAIPDQALSVSGVTWEERLGGRADSGGAPSQLSSPGSQVANHIMAVTSSCAP